MRVTRDRVGLINEDPDGTVETQHVLDPAQPLTVLRWDGIERYKVDVMVYSVRLVRRPDGLIGAHVRGDVVDPTTSRGAKRLRDYFLYYNHRDIRSGQVLGWRWSWDTPQWLIDLVART